MAEVWYLSAVSQKGFTDDPTQALQDRFGNAVVAPGPVTKVWHAVYAKWSAQQEQIWEVLLDSMEGLYSLHGWENPRTMDPKDKRKYYELKGKIHGLSLALVTLRHAEKDGSVKDPDKALGEVQREADIRYEASSE